MIYNIAGRVFYANNQIRNALYAFQKANSLSEEDLIYLGLSYLKLFQRYMERHYLTKALRVLSRIKKVTKRVKKVLEVLSFDPELKSFVEQHIQTAAVSQDQEPLVHDIYRFLRERGKFYSHKAIEQYWRGSLRQPVKDPVMLAQMVIYSLYKRKPLSEITPEDLIKLRYFPLGYNPTKLPNVIKRYLQRIYDMDYEIYTLNMLSPHLSDKIKAKKQSLLKHLNKLYYPLKVYFPEENVSTLYANIIKSLRSLTPQEKWELLDKY